MTGDSNSDYLAQNDTLPNGLPLPNDANTSEISINRSGTSSLFYGYNTFILPAIGDQPFSKITVTYQGSEISLKNAETSLWVTGPSLYYQRKWYQLALSNDANILHPGVRYWLWCNKKGACLNFATPRILQFNPNSGVIGAQITIIGKNFEAVPGEHSVKFNTVSAAFSSWNDTAIICTVPIVQTSGGPVAVTVKSGLAESNPATFTIIRSWLSLNPEAPASITNIWGSNPNDVFVVGNSGMILHYNGSTWTQMTSGTSNKLEGVWGSEPDNVFTAGQGGTILHYNGSSWSAMSSGVGTWFRDMGGTDSTHIYAVGWPGIIVRYDGAGWSTVHQGGYCYNGIRGTGGNTYFVVGDHGTILYYDGNNFYGMDSGTAINLYGIWGSSPNDVFAAGNSGIILHYNGSTWTQMASGTGSNITDVWGNSSNDVYAVCNGGAILHYNGSSWSSMGVSGSFNGLWGSLSGDIFAAGDGTVLRY